MLEKVNGNLLKLKTASKLVPRCQRGSSAPVTKADGGADWFYVGAAVALASDADHRRLQLTTVFMFVHFFTILYFHASQLWQVCSLGALS